MRAGSTPWIARQKRGYLSREPLNGKRPECRFTKLYLRMHAFGRPESMSRE